MLQNFLSNSIYKIAEMVDVNISHNQETPRNIHLSEKEDNLTIEYSWFKMKYLVALILCPVFSYILIESPYIQGSLRHITFPVIMFFIINVFVLYYCLAKLINTTTIHVNSERIDIVHRPFPFSKNIRINRTNLAQLYVARKLSSHRYYHLFPSYQINAILKDDHIFSIIRGLQDPGQGQFIEQKIEQFLGITDIEVDGEIEKD